MGPKLGLKILLLFLSMESPKTTILTGVLDVAKVRHTYSHANLKRLKPLKLQVESKDGYIAQSQRWLKACLSGFMMFHVTLCGISICDSW